MYRKIVYEFAKAPQRSHLHPRRVVRHKDALSRIPSSMKRFHQRLVRNIEKQSQSEDRTKRYPPKPGKGDKCGEDATCFEVLTPR